jgi:prephenate dehydrogenase
MRPLKMPLRDGQVQTGEKSERSSEIPRCVGIVGLGLIGGSLARALKMKAGIPRIIAFDMDQKTLSQAMDDRMIDQSHLLVQQPIDTLDFSALTEAELVFICTPVQSIPALADRIAVFCKGLLTDVGSTKSSICSAVQTKQFVGGHPMAGSERVGYGASVAGLFENAVYVLCLANPDSSLPPNLRKSIQQLENLICSIGAFPMRLTPEIHDLAVAAISHLPHVAASSLALLVARSDQGALARLAAGGFRDITRIASSDAALWTQICISARPALLPLIHAYRDTLAEFAAALDQSNEQALLHLFAEAADYRNNLPVDGRGALEALSSLTVYVPDKPGELGRVTTLLGSHGINIRNIRIRDVRTYEGGCLQILLPDGRQAKDAAARLKEAGYAID